MNNYQEKKLKKIERYQNLAEKNRQLSDEKAKEAYELIDMIPFGQPILIGHYSSRRSRRHAQKIDSALGQSVKAEEKAEYYEQKAEGALNNNSISSDDPEAVEKIKNKINEVKELHKKMKDENKKVKNTYATYELAYKLAEIKRLEKRLARLEKSRATPTTEKIINGARVVDNAEANRIQIFFDEIPSFDLRTRLKRGGFRWTPSLSCWQAYRNNRAKYNLDVIFNL